MNSLKSHFKFSKQERSGIFFLLLLLILIQVGYFLFNESGVDTKDSMIFDVETQQKITLLKKESTQKDTIVIYPFNPNFISDYKGYTLGMSVEEIDRLHNFRSTNKFVNSSEEFQKVTFISDSLLNLISPYFKFPEWTKKSKPFSDNYDKSKVENIQKKIYEITDLNLATSEDLQRVSGIGEKLSVRIVKFRDRLGGFLVDEQLYDVYGLKPEVAQRTLEQFRIKNVPNIEKINVNTASVQELTKLIYLQRNVAEGIVDYRNLNGGIHSLDELSKIENFPTEKIDRIALYLSLKK